ncbi:hypothetical protein GCM10023340_39270 [Nocardioides marinquilinus]|uniref:DUF1795 domain-containing protein n=1 Tax=Nocardioides marinquilinus TaxID=1210400 RepID=A0ABP9Q0K1_9ACTN
MVGTGYRYRLPNRAWSDLTAEAQRRNPQFMIDSFIVLGTAIDTAQSNILVERSVAVGSPTLDELEPLWRANLSQADGAEPDDVPDIMIDGERAIGVEFDDRQNQDGLSIDQVAYLVQRDGMQYSIGLSLPGDGDLISRDDFERMLASWRWDA